MVLKPEQVSEIKKRLLDQLQSLPEDKRAEVKVQIEQMNASQLEEFLRQNVKADECVFCSIVEGKAESYKVYEDEDFICVLNIRPLTKGHLLLIPRNHHFEDEKKLLEKGKILGEILQGLFPEKKIEYKQEKMFEHKYLSILPHPEKEESFEPNERYFKEFQKTFKESLEKQPEEVEEKQKKEIVEEKVLHQARARIP